MGQISLKSNRSEETKDLGVLTVVFCEKLSSKLHTNTLLRFSRSQWETTQRKYSGSLRGARLGEARPRKRGCSLGGDTAFFSLEASEPKELQSPPGNMT